MSTPPPPTETELTVEEPVAEPGPPGATADADTASAGRSSSALRLTVAVLCTTVGAGVLIGGIFTDVEARPYAVIAGILGGLLAYGAQRLRSSWGPNVAIVLGLAAIGIVIALPVAGPGALLGLKTTLGRELAEARLLRPPIQLTSGFALVMGWVMGGLGFSAVWTAVVFRRPSFGLLLPLPLAGIAAISVSSGEQAIDGLILLVLFAVGLGVIAGSRETADGEQGPSLGYELRRAAKALPLLAALTAGLAVLLNFGLLGFLFPRPVIAPQYQAQRPKTVPLSEAQDRDLFDVQSSVAGPFVVGALDVYDGNAWLLPALDDADLRPLTASGVVDPSLASKTGLLATITIRGLSGAVLPTLPNTTGILASGPKLAYDARSGNIRLVEGEISSGFTYKVAAAAVPAVTDLEKVSTWPGAYDKFLQIPAPGPVARGYLAAAPTTSKWAEWNSIRLKILANITAAGLGTPVDISPKRVDAILTKKEGTPFEIIAVQAMFARWVGIPARIGYGFDAGAKVNGHYEIHPRDGAAFPEVFFPDSGWIPVIGRPAHAKADLNANPNIEQFLSGIQPSQDVGVFLVLPSVLPAPSTALETARNYVLLAAAVLAAIGLLYLLYPLAAKALIRARRRALARQLGPRARVALAYAEWRDALTDYGYRFPSDSPLLLLDRFPDDDDHSELAWLVTRALWGDLQDQITPARATDAEELSTTLRRRLAQAHPITERAVAAVSRLSLHEPYAPEATAVHVPAVRREVARVAAL